MKASLIIKNISSLVTARGDTKLRCGKAQGELEIIKNGLLAADGEKIVFAGSMDDIDKIEAREGAEIIEAKNKTVTPGLIDSHTHLVHGGSREKELSMKLSGKSYMDIMRAGGGIHSTQRATKEASFEELYDKAKKSLDIMLSYGVTTVEAKSGYGIEDFDTEIKQLNVAKKLNEDHPVDIVSTFMPAHAMPEEYKYKREDFINKIIKEYNPYVIKERLAEFADVFCEDGVYDIEETRRILKASIESGFKIKLHADELESFGGAELAAELKAKSADHLIGASDTGIKLMAKNGVIANLLPATSLNLGATRFARARKMIEEGLAVAISTDYNPGSSPCENIFIAMYIAAVIMKMTPNEIFNAVTVNASHSLDRACDRGSLEEGKLADIAIFNGENIDYLIYHFGINHTYKVIKRGKTVYGEKAV